MFFSPEITNLVSIVSCNVGVTEVPPDHLKFFFCFYMFSNSILLCLRFGSHFHSLESEESYKGQYYYRRKFREVLIASMKVSALQFALFTVLDTKHWLSLIILFLSSVWSALHLLMNTFEILDYCRVKYGLFYMLAHWAFGSAVAFHMLDKEYRWIFVYTFACCLIDWVVANYLLLVDPTMGGQKKPKSPPTSIFENYI
ncbi:unnamed protein product [Caenorhabditis nigoni]